MFVQSVCLAVAAISISIVVLFVGVNVGTGCQDWSESNCVTPAQFLSILIDR